MALTSQQITSLLQITQAMFNATPGKVYFNDLSSQLKAGNSIAMIAQSFLGTVFFLGKDYSYGFGNFPSETIINDLVGDRASADNKTSAIAFIDSLVVPNSSINQIMSEVIRILSAFPVTDQNWGAAALHYNTENANKVVNNLLADTVSADVKASAVSAILAQMATGKTFGEAVVWATTTLDEIATTDPVWGNAARLFDNRIEVSRYYSIEKNGSLTNLPFLQQILSSVTADTISVATAKTVIDDLIDNSTNLADLNGTNGFRLDGEVRGDRTGISVGSAGDINGDGFDDLIIGSPLKYSTGNSYVVFGKASGFNAVLPLSSLDGTNGFRINGVAWRDRAGQGVGSAGDINGDGIDDLIVGARHASTPDGEYYSGNAYVIFGKTSGFDASLNLSELDGENGFRMSLDEPSARLGRSVSSAGDVNGDGIDDLIVGAYDADTSAGDYSGNSYVIFGKTSGFDANLELSDLDGSNGFKIQGIVAGERHGFSVSAGDINGDGFSDLISGSFNPSLLDDGLGTTYIVFGKASSFEAIVDLASLNGVNGFSIEGENANDEAGVSVDNAGDINGDGFDDVLIGARGFYGSYDDSGAAYIVFGKASGFSSTIKLSELNGDDGFRLVGAELGDYTGTSVSTAGDFNGDGFDDLIIGAPNAKPNGIASGTAYVIFGKPSTFDSSINLANLKSNLNSSMGFIIDGLAALDRLGASVSSAGDINKDGFDDLIIGAPLADGAAFDSGAGYVIFGRSTATPISSPESTQDMVNLVGVNQIIEAS